MSATCQNEQLKIQPLCHFRYQPLQVSGALLTVVAFLQLICQRKQQLLAVSTVTNLKAEGHVHQHTSASALSLQVSTSSSH